MSATAGALIGAGVAMSMSGQKLTASDAAVMWLFVVWVAIWAFCYFKRDDMKIWGGRRTLMYWPYTLIHWASAVFASILVIGFTLVSILYLCGVR